MSNPYESPQSAENPYVPPATSLEKQTNLADRGTRFLASIIDGLIGMAVTFPLMFFTGYLQRAVQQQVTMGEIVLYTIAGFGIFLLIHGYLLATRGQTVGKYVVGIQIVDYPMGNLLSFGKLLGLRVLPVQLLAVVPFIGGLLVLVDVLFIFTEERRCLHDLIANTKVVKVEGSGASFA